MANPQLDRLTASLVQSKLQTDNNPLFQTIKGLIDFNRQIQDELGASIVQLQKLIDGGNTPNKIGGLLGGTYLTKNDDHATLPNARQEIAGTGIILDDSTPHKRIISSSAVGTPPVFFPDDIVGETPMVPGPIGPTGANGGDWIKIAESTPSGTGVVTFSTLGLYTHLRIIFLARGTQSATSTAINLTFNNDGSAIYDEVRLNVVSGTITGADQVAQTSGIIAIINAATAPTSSGSAGEIIIADYRNTTFHKAAICQNSDVLAASTTNIQYRAAQVTYRSTSALTRIDLTLASGNYVTGSKFSLYGIN